MLPTWENEEVYGDLYIQFIVISTWTIHVEINNSDSVWCLACNQHSGMHQSSANNAQVAQVHEIMHLDHLLTAGKTRRVKHIEWFTQWHSLAALMQLIMSSDSCKVCRSVRKTIMLLAPITNLWITLKKMKTLYKE